MLGRLRPDEALQLTLLAEGEQPHVTQLHRRQTIVLFQRSAARIDDVFAIARPQPAAGGHTQVASLHPRLHHLRLLVTPRRQCLAHDHHADNQHRNHADRTTRDAQARHAGGTQGGEFAGASQSAQAEQAADQRRVAEHLVGAARKGHQHVGNRIARVVAVLADVAQLHEQDSHRIETGQHQPHHQHRTEHAQRDQSVDPLDGEHAHAATADGGTRRLRGEYCFHNIHPASANTSACSAHSGASLCQ